MPVLDSLRARSALIAAATAVAAFSAAALPAAAAPAPTTFTFTLGATNDVTNFVTCPPGTPAGVILCGYGFNESITSASNTGDDAGLSGTAIKESFISTLQAPISTAACPELLPDFSAITLRTTRGDLILTTHNGGFCVSTNSDVEPFTIDRGTGDYARATGSGFIDAHATLPRTATQGFAAETYTGTITLASR